MNNKCQRILRLLSMDRVKKKPKKICIFYRCISRSTFTRIKSRVDFILGKNITRYEEQFLSFKCRHCQKNKKKQGHFGPECERKAIRDMSSALEFTIVWWHKEIETQTHPTAGLELRRSLIQVLM